MVELPGGISPPGAPRSVREPLDSHGSRCSAVSMAQLPMSEERRICAAKPIKIDIGNRSQSHRCSAPDGLRPATAP